MMVELCLLAAMYENHLMVYFEEMMMLKSMNDDFAKMINLSVVLDVRIVKMEKEYLIATYGIDM